MLGGLKACVSVEVGPGASVYFVNCINKGLMDILKLAGVGMAENVQREVSMSQQ